MLSNRIWQQQVCPAVRAEGFKVLGKLGFRFLSCVIDKGLFCYVLIGMVQIWAVSQGISLFGVGNSSAPRVAPVNTSTFLGP